MSVDVLAVMDRIASFHHPIDRIDVQQARAAIAELIAAAQSLYESERKWPKKPPDTVMRAEQIMAEHNAKIERLRAALAAVGGEVSDA